MKIKSIWLVVSAGVFLIAVGAILWLQAPPWQSLSVLAGSKAGALSVSSPDKVAINTPFDVTLTMNTAGKNVNALGLYLHYEPQKLQLIQMDTRPSFCQFYPEKRFDNQLGTVSLACGAPHPGVTGESTVLLLQFMPVALGDTTIQVSPNSQILQSNGEGTNILREYPKVPVRIANSL